VQGRGACAVEMPRVVVVEDEPQTVHLLDTNLNTHRYEQPNRRRAVATPTTLTEALWHLRSDRRSLEPAAGECCASRRSRSLVGRKVADSNEPVNGCVNEHESNHAKDDSDDNRWVSLSRRRQRSLGRASIL
jgi:hypothetical protein